MRFLPLRTLNWIKVILVEQDKTDYYLSQDIILQLYSFNSFALKITPNMNALNQIDDVFRGLYEWSLSY